MWGVRYLYRVLGATQVLREDGTAVPVGGARLRALLTALALAGGRAVRPGQLAAAVWAQDEDAPADETAAVQALVGRVRRALGRDAVVWAEGGYRLAVTRDDVDLFRFERLADEGADALADGDPVKATALLDDALALCRGPALADLPDGGGPAAVRAADRELTARRDRMRAALALGRAETVLPGVRELAAAHPLDESLQALLLRALHGAGRTAEALASYETVRARIADRLGSGPGAELRALHAALLAADDPAPDPSSPAGLSCLPSPASPSSPPAGSVRPVGNLRARLTSFVGRDEEIGALGQELGGARLVTLTGPGGAGKTRLSLETAARTGAEGGAAWRDGVWVAELASVRGRNGPAEVAEAVLTALGGRETVLIGSSAESLHAAADRTAGDPVAQLVEHCAARRMLLVLDNCEHVIDAAARVVETLLVECPGVTVLATSREPLGVPGESVRPVGPLPEPVALRLLADRGARARAGFSTDEDPEACAEICHRLDGLPLAIELAAARLRSLTPGQLARRLDDRFRLLTSGSRTVLPRQQTLRAVVDWSWELLEEPERAVLLRLSVFAGGCELEQAEEVCAAAREGGAGADTAALLSSLVDKSLVVAAPGDGRGAGMRYRLLETVAEYAAEKLDALPGERERAEARHLVAYRELARTADPLLRGPRQAVWLECLEREHDNIRTALRRAVAAGEEQEALCVILSMGWFWQLRGHRADALTWGEAALRLGPAPFAEQRTVPPLYESATHHPPPMSEEQLWEARRGVRLMVLADAEEGVERLRSPERQAELATIMRSYTPGMPQVCRIPGCMWMFAWLHSGNYEALHDLTDAHVQGCRDLGYEWELAFALQLRSKIGADVPDAWDQTGVDADESLEIFRRLGDAWGEAEALAGRSEALSARGEFARAAADCRLAIARAQELGAHSQVPRLKSRLGSVLVELADPESVAEGDLLMREATEEAKYAGGGGPNFASIQLAAHLIRTGEPDAARALLEPLEREFEDRVPQLFVGMVQGMLAWSHVVAGRPAEALAKLRVSIGRTCEAMADVVSPQLTQRQLVTAARAMAALGRGAEAGRLLGAADALTTLPSGPFLPPAEREARQAAEEAVRAVLSPGQYADTHSEGGGLTLEEAVALVQGTRREAGA
ncbi:AfsR/SARP family transcriptional regulator [Streptomyces reniochalinae]|uniref:AfsR/SARP family transcriptional regulator n=1 Tax=Streptomyces reniochalinae TaxID=2250578 RepID=A0A367EAD6_9ACTN|nr:BTAD domain-containing putative transcriptional regulator [Streptomyces reniochalinae]RCG15018.1 AfsR/SARP family transcriptional regulator [Streptomyces reniochalinae]